jgi:hypothetical protein
MSVHTETSKGSLTATLFLSAERGVHRLRERLDGITDEEYLWEPVAGCWSVRRREDARSPHPHGPGEWVFDDTWNEPDPPPFTTIAWRLMHLVGSISGYAVFLWGNGELTDNWHEVTPVAAEGVALWDMHASAFVEALSAEDDASLERQIIIPRCPEETPRWRIVANVIGEMRHHGAEVGVLRDLYRNRGSWQGS